VKVEAVALDLGYRSKKNFYRQFKRRFGMTPEAYRQRYCPEAGQPEVSIVAADATGAKRRNVRPGSLTRRIVRALVSHRVAMLATDDTGCCIAANEVAVSITGYSVSELRRMPAAALFLSDIRSDARSRVQILLPASASLPANAVLRTRSAGNVHVHLTSVENLLGNTDAALIAASDGPSAHSAV
jgi:PAS domain-containing protein